ncbi:TSC22 domain family protein 4 [Lissotriton helveticus]
MSTGKKRSGFQITSVTSDYGQAGSEGRKESFGSDPDSPKLSPLPNGGLRLPGRSPRGSPRSSPPASANAHPVGPPETLLLPTAPTTKEVNSHAADEARAVPVRNRDEGAATPVVVEVKSVTVSVDSGGTLVAPHGTRDETLSSYPASSSSTVLTNGEVSNGRQTHSGGPPLILSTANGHAGLVNGTSSPSESKAGTSNGAISKNGPILLMPSSSLVSTVSSVSSFTASSSRFRVVKLDQGPGEPYKRGRWTCVDFYDRDMDHLGISKILDSMRHGHSLDSHLEAAGLSFKPVTQFCPQSPGKGHSPTYVHSQGNPQLVLHNATLSVTAPHQPRSLSVLPQISFELNQGAGMKSPLSPRNSPTCEFLPFPPLPRTSDASQVASTTTTRSDARSASSCREVFTTSVSEAGSSGDLGTRGQQVNVRPSGGSSPSPLGFRSVPVVVVDEPGTSHPLSKSALQLTHVDEKRKAPPRHSRSRSPSPSRRRFRESSPISAISDPLGMHSVRLGLARSMFSMSASPDSDDESGSSSSMVAIDNKIEQAMDLVKTHLMFAVREEVDVLRDQIKDLMDRNALLEQENSVLKSLASPDQLSEMQAKMQSLRLAVAAPPASSSTA